MTNGVAQPTLYELAFGCWVYQTITGYDSSVTELRNATGGQVDPHNLNHRRLLFKWLRQWGCRQFKKADQDTIAGQSLDAWAGKWLTRLPTDDVTLETINKAQIGEISNAYDDLRKRQAGPRTLPGGSISDVTYGPVGAAKTLFALWPNICPPWDNYILHFLGFNCRIRRKCGFIPNTPSTAYHIAHSRSCRIAMAPCGHGGGRMAVSGGRSAGCRGRS